ncbi:hypothetical protein G195_008322 [Phytophthora kernoviae 00238/432]|uniref:Ankyrin repeat-containing domain n=1 Tax=Phytophthora kernoviae 00238/432 TaxID=1284355 RepID=A0A8J4SAT8_9STRA|nr:hypothetical protein G195_008322 [Phytophthora kernoviae 00238/432]
MVREAARKGHTHVLKWLDEHDDNSCNLWKDYDFSPMDEAAKFGHLDAMQWLHENHNDCYAGPANGHLEVVQWLDRYRNDECTTWAMDGAAQNNHLDVVQWLHSNRREGCTKAAIDGAAARGHLSIVKWILENVAGNGGMQWWGWAFTAAVDNGQVDIAKWMYVTFQDRMTDSIIRSALSTAEENGHEKMVQWLRMEQRVR